MLVSLNTSADASWVLHSVTSDLWYTWLRITRALELKLNHMLMDGSLIFIPDDHHVYLLAKGKCHNLALPSHSISSSLVPHSSPSEIIRSQRTMTEQPRASHNLVTCSHLVCSFGLYCDHFDGSSNHVCNVGKFATINFDSIIIFQLIANHCTEFHVVQSTRTQFSDPYVHSWNDL